MRKTRRTIIACLTLSLFLLPVGVLQNAYAASSDLNHALVTFTGDFNRHTLDVYQWQGVDWVMFYIGFSTDAANYVHSLGMKAMVYVTALKEPASSYRYTDKKWAQYNGTYYVHPDDMPTTEIWFSPYGPYVDQILLPNIRSAIQSGADGVFLDTLILYPNADVGPYAYEAWKEKYSNSTMQFGSQEFRYRETYDVLERVYQTLKAANKNAILIVSNNTVYKQSDRDRFASSIDKWQGIADGFLLEYSGVDSPDSPQDVVKYLLMPERDTYGVTKPLWLIYYTMVDGKFQYLTSASSQNNFGYWTYDQYLLQPNLIVYDGNPYHLSVQSNSTVSNFRFDRARRLINFSVSGSSGTIGLANVVIPIALLSGNPIIMLDNRQIAPTLLSQNSTHYTIKFSYTHSTHQVTIGGANTIPEFPYNSSVLILTATLLMVALIFRKRKRV